MIAPKFVPLIVKQVVRHRARTALTVLGVAIAMFLFSVVQAMHQGVASVTRASAQDTTLIVYRKDRFCPATSTLPQDYVGRIERIEGVRSVIPVKIVVSNCRTSLDVVTFRGVPKDGFLEQKGKKIRVIDGSMEQWMSRTDAALLGETLAKRRGLKPGDRFDAAGITAYVAGIIESDEHEDANVAYTSLEFVQLAGRNELGIVTQFNVTVDDPSMLDGVAEAIDTEFASAQEPTDTFTEKAFIGRVADDVIELVGFARWLGLGCLVAVLALVGNAIVLSMQSRIAEHAVLRTLGYTGGLIGRMVVGEGLVLALLGGALGAAGAVLAIRSTGYALSTEGNTIPITAGPDTFLVGLAICAVLGILAGAVPAVRAARRDIAACFRAV